MEIAGFTQTPIFVWVFLPLLIFMARICDVSIGTIRVIFIGRGFRWQSAVLGFFEVLIWLTAINQIMSGEKHLIHFMAYASGYATGTYVGIWLEGKLSLGKVIIRVITRLDATELAASLRDADYMTTILDAEGSLGKVKVIFTVVERQKLPKVVALIKQFNPNAFYTVEDVRFVSQRERPPETSEMKRIGRMAAGTAR
jgi:uncharacterized protein YebE (UPF0316 family)